VLVILLNFVAYNNRDANDIHFFGYRFMFYSNDHEPIHVHILKDGCEAKYNVCPIMQVYNHGFKKHDITLIESLLEENEEIIKNRWKTFFDKE